MSVLLLKKKCIPFTVIKSFCVCICYVFMSPLDQYSDKQRHYIKLVVACIFMASLQDKDW